jgi:adenylate kinase family enzyme
MQRIAIIGSPGAGKSTLARQLGRVLAVKAVHLDTVFWKPNWDDVPKAVWTQTLGELLNREQWILDGNHSEAVDCYLAAADTIVFIDLHRTICVFRMVRRFIQYRKCGRPDLPEYDEVFDWDVLKGIWMYPIVERPLVLLKLNQYTKGRTVYRLRTQADIQHFLQEVKEAKSEHINR